MAPKQPMQEGKEYNLPGARLWLQVSLWAPTPTCAGLQAAFPSESDSGRLQHSLELGCVRNLAQAWAETLCEPLQASLPLFLSPDLVSPQS